MKNRKKCYVTQQKIKLKEINESIKPLGLQINKRRGYLFFSSLENDKQVGEIVPCTLNYYTHYEWFRRGEKAIAEQAAIDRRDRIVDEWTQIILG